LFLIAGYVLGVVKGIERRPKVFIKNVRVPLSCGDAGMAERLGHKVDVPGFTQELSRMVVTEVMKPERLGYSGFEETSLKTS